MNAILHSGRGLALFLLAIVWSNHGWTQQTTAFTYQGQLRDTGTNANGSYTMIFKLFDAANNGNKVGFSITNSPTLANGLFTVNLDFGGTAFNGAARWLDITIQAGTNAPETLTPRVQVMPAPYALFAATAGTVTNGAIKNAQLANNAVAECNLTNLAVTTAKISNEAVTTVKIADGNVTNQKLAVPAVATFNLFDGAVTNPKLAASAVATANLQDASVTNPKLAANAVATVNLQDASVTNPKLAVNAVASVNIQDATITRAKFAANQVVTSLNGLSDMVTLAAGPNVFLTTNGNTLTVSAGTNRVSSIQVFIGGSGTFTVPAGVRRIMVEMYGGGGGGGAGYFDDTTFIGNPGGGGGSSAYALHIMNVTPGASYPVTVGAGGAPGLPGGDSTFGGFLTVQGGEAGSSGTAGVGGDGGRGGEAFGASPIGLVGFPGADGASAFNIITQESGPNIGGNGGTAYRGGQGGFGYPFGASTLSHNREGRTPGGGGGGGGGVADAANRAGGKGGNGGVLIHY